MDEELEIVVESKPESNPLEGSSGSCSDSIVTETEREPAARITIDKQGGCVAFSTASAFLQFPPDAVSEPVTLTCSRVRYKDCDVKAKRGDAFCSRILKIEPEGIAFEKPVTVLLAHSAAEDGADADYYDLVVQRLNVECEDLKIERISKYEDLPKEIVSDFSHFIKYLPFAKANIVKTCTLVVASRIRSEEIVIQQRVACIYSKSYGDESKLKLNFPAGVVENESRLRVQILATTPGISLCLVDNSRCSYTFSTDENQTKREIDEKTFHLVKARSLALQFMAANPTCIRAIPYSEDDNNKRMTMCLYMHTGCKGITAALRKRATEMLVGYTLEFVDLERRPLVENVVLLPSNKKTKTEELSHLAEIIDENLGVFENRLNVTAVQPSYKIVNAQETSDLCVTVFVLGKGELPVGESDFSEVEQLSGYPYDIVEGYGIPTSSPFRSTAFPLRSGVGIGVKDQHEGTGTLGAFVVDEYDNRYILSCEHVLRPDLRGISDKIVQPSEEDYIENVNQLDRDIATIEKTLKYSENRKLSCINENESVEWERRVKTHEEELEFKKSEKEYNVRNQMPRKIATYRCGVRGNAKKEISTNVTREFWVDAAVADLDPREEEEIRDLGFPVEMPKIDEIISMHNFEEDVGNVWFMKYGRTTGYTDLGELRQTHFQENHAGFKAETCFGIFTNTHFETYCTRCSPEMCGEIIETSKIDKLTCAKCKTEYLKPERIGKLWAKNCFIIQKKKKLFSDEGDSGALVYDKHCKLRDKHDKHDEHCLVNRAWGIITGSFDTCNFYLSIAISLEVALEALGEELGKTGETGKTLRLWCPEET